MAWGLQPEETRTWLSMGLATARWASIVHWGKISFLYYHCCFMAMMLWPYLKSHCLVQVQEDIYGLFLKSYVYFLHLDPWSISRQFLWMVWSKYRELFPSICLSILLLQNRLKRQSLPRWVTLVFLTKICRLYACKTFLDFLFDSILHMAAFTEIRLCLVDCGYIVSLKINKRQSSNCPLLFQNCLDHSSSIAFSFPLCN